MAALAVRGGCVLAVAANRGGWRQHAERRVLRPHDNLEGSTVYIVRSNRKCSKPCPECRRLLEESKVSCIVYINEQGTVVKERL